MDKVIGVIGGMGPEATVDLFKKIIKSTPAKFDQDHLHIVVDNNPQIPDRVKAVFGKGEDPAPALIKTARNLERAGAELLVIACNAAHYYHPKIADSVSCPVLHIMRETGIYCVEHFPQLKNFGLLAGTSTLEMDLYQKAFNQIERKILHPEPKDQEKVLDSIYKVKAGDLGPSTRAKLLEVAQNLHTRGAEAIILGCTEIPLILSDGDLQFPFIDATQALAEAAVIMALGKPRKELSKKRNV